MSPETQALLDRNIRALSRAITRIENETHNANTLLDAIYPHIGKAYRIGVTGPPGSGKSTLVDKLIEHYRSVDLTVGVISIDPTSPFTGGALLGDRIRMSSHSGDPGVYIRSMASRGSLGGLAVKAQEAGDLLDAAGYDIILFETVGVGQVELDIAEVADTTMVVLVPESGDEVQAMKSGLMEIADLFVLNKSDREGADKACLELSSILKLKTLSPEDWEFHIIQTSALNNEGIAELIDTIQSHHQYLNDNDVLRKKRQTRYKHRVENVIRQELEEQFWTSQRLQILKQVLNEIETVTTSPYALARELAATVSFEE